jgi:predicted site-specific integrase-resolvase
MQNRLNEEAVLTKTEAAAIIGVHFATLNRLVSAGRLHPVLSKPYVLLDREEVERYAAAYKWIRHGDQDDESEAP